PVADAGRGPGGPELVPRAAAGAPAFGHVGIVGDAFEGVVGDVVAEHVERVRDAAARGPRLAGELLDALAHQPDADTNTDADGGDRHNNWHMIAFHHGTREPCFLPSRSHSSRD